MEQEMTFAVCKCIICEHHKTRGITVCDTFICEACEREMIRTDVQEAKYPVFVKRLRRIWLKDA